MSVLFFFIFSSIVSNLLLFLCHMMLNSESESSSGTLSAVGSCCLFDAFLSGAYPESYKIRTGPV